MLECLTDCTVINMTCLRPRSHVQCGFKLLGFHHLHGALEMIWKLMVPKDRSTIPPLEVIIRIVHSWGMYAVHSGDSFNTWPRRTLPASEQLSPCATTSEPTCRNYWSLHALELVHKRIHHNERSLYTATRGWPAQQQRPSINKINQKVIFKKKN